MRGLSSASLALGRATRSDQASGAPWAVCGAVCDVVNRYTSDGSACGRIEQALDSSNAPATANRPRG